MKRPKDPREQCECCACFVELFDPFDDVRLGEDCAEGHELYTPDCLDWMDWNEEEDEKA